MHVSEEENSQVNPWIYDQTVGEVVITYKEAIRQLKTKEFRNPRYMHSLVGLPLYQLLKLPCVCIAKIVDIWNLCVYNSWTFAYEVGAKCLNVYQELYRF